MLLSFIAAVPLSAASPEPQPVNVLLEQISSYKIMQTIGQDSVEEAWRVMQPLIDSPSEVHTYEPGTWGPAAAGALVSEHGGWRGPWI